MIKDERSYSNLTIVIPCKNEEKRIGNLLQSIYYQTLMPEKIVIADADSTDDTLKEVNKFKTTLPIEIAKGGMPAVGRNVGAKNAKTDYVLFIDADIDLIDYYTLRTAMDKMTKKDLHLLTAKLGCKDLRTSVLYAMTNLLTLGSKLSKPFVTGMFMLVKRSEFEKLGGFPTWAKHCEDYLLSKKFDRKKFGIVNCKVWSDDRRFKKMGHLGMVLYVIKNFLKRNDDDYFKKDVSYWE